MFRRAPAIALVVTILALSMPLDALARAGGGFSFGSRGSRTFSLPSTTATAPRPAAPLERDLAPSPGFGARGTAPGGLFSGGFGRGLVGGLLGAGLFGMLFGNGLFGGLGEGTSFIGLILQFGLLYLGIRLAVGFFRNRAAVAFAPAAAFNAGPMPRRPRATGAGPTANSGAAPRIVPADFDTFERRLGEIQTAYGAEAADRLGRLATPAMAARFATEIAGNAGRGLVNRLGNVRLLQGDLAEAWREAGNDFASLAMRYAIIDTTVERATGRIVAGNPSEPQTVTEVWTFVRPAGAGPAAWTLSAIQQA